MSRTEIAAAIVTRHIMTSISDAKMHFASEACSSVVTGLADRDFDNAPVKDSGGRIIGHVNKREAEGLDSRPVESCYQPLDATRVVSAEAPISELLGRLEAVDFIFVVGVSGIAGLVTPSDMNKQAGRTYFYLLLVELELALAECVRRREFNLNEVVSYLDQNNADRLQSNLRSQSQDDVAADVVAAMYFSDLLMLVENARIISGLNERFVDGGPVRREVKDFRNQVMHPNKTMVTDRKSSIARLNRLDACLRQLLSEAEAAGGAM